MLRIRPIFLNASWKLNATETQQGSTITAVPTQSSDIQVQASTLRSIDASTRELLT